MISVLRSYKWAILWASLIFVLCAIPGRDLPHFDWLEILQFDKWVHAGMFFILFLLAGKAYTISHSSSFNLQNKLILFVACSTYGTLLELMQAFVFVDRSFDIYDEIANSFGAGMGVLLFDKVVNLWRENK